jgi:hypothetical protein
MRCWHRSAQVVLRRTAIWYASHDLVSVADAFGAAPTKLLSETRVRLAAPRRGGAARHQFAAERMPPSPRSTLAIRPTSHEQEIAGSAELTPEPSATRRNAGGFAIGTCSTRRAATTRCSRAAGGAGRRADYLVALAGNLALEVDALRSAWGRRRRLR